MTKQLALEIRKKYEYKGAIIYIDKSEISEQNLNNCLESQFINIYKNSDFTLNDVLIKHKLIYGQPIILMIDNIQRVFNSSYTKNYDKNWFSSLTVYMDAELLKIMVVSSEYDVFFSIKSLSNSWFNRVIEYRMPILSEKNREIKDYLLSSECRQIFQYEDPETDVVYATKFLSNQLRFYLPLMKIRRKEFSFKGN